jgi:hypothetical protein
MSSIIPKAIQDKIAFFESHLATWATEATNIGTTAAAVTDLQTKTASARSGYNDQQEAHDIAKSKTAAMRQAVDAMVLAGSDIIKQIKTKAALSGDSIYTLANIPAPATPSPVPPPGTPFQMKVALYPDGSIQLAWKCNNPVGSVGTLYNVFRQLGGAGDFVFIGGVGQRDFVDATIPAGTSMVVYKIQAVRSSAIGVAGEFNVKFGSTSGGAMTASVVETTPTGPKIAA